MTKIEELKAAFEACGMALPIRIEDETFLVDAEHEMICNTEAANPEELKLIVGAINLMPTLLAAADNLRIMVEVFNRKEIDPLAAFAAIEQARHALEELT